MYRIVLIFRRFSIVILFYFTSFFWVKSFKCLSSEGTCHQMNIELYIRWREKKRTEFHILNHFFSLRYEGKAFDPLVALNHGTIIRIENKLADVFNQIGMQCTQHGKVNAFAAVHLVFMEASQKQRANAASK